MDEHQQLVYDGLGQCLTVERVKQWVNPPLEVVDHAFLLSLRTFALLNEEKKEKDNIRALLASNAPSVPSTRYRSATPTRECVYDRPVLYIRMIESNNRIDPCRAVTYGISAGEVLSAEPPHAPGELGHSDHSEEVRAAEAPAHPMDAAPVEDLSLASVDLE